jgi:sugar/nucleoside kinase (ribokinase family)
VERIAVLGNVSLDRVDGGPPRAGGAPFYCGRALAALGAPCVVATACSAGHRALLVEPVEALGLEVAWREADATAVFGMRNRGDVREMQVEAVGPVWSPADVERLGPALAGAAWVHVAGLLRSDFPAETLAALARAHRVSLDAQGLVRAAHVGPLRQDAEFDPAVLEHVALLKVSDEEAQALVGSAEPDALRALGVPEIVLTLGSRGSVVIDGPEATHVPARSALVDDPTGAGDMFTAAYVVARADGAAPVAAADRAAGLVARLLAP